jgi:hypothetical protein
LPFGETVGLPFGSFASRMTSVMVLPRPGALEMTLTDGSSWLTYAPMSSNRPPQLTR